MNNPFVGNASPVRRLRNLIGREDVFSLLETKLRNRQNTVIMGPEGVGKSSLLNCFFNRETRLRFAREEGMLIARTDFPVHLPSDEVYHHLTEAIVSALDILDETDPALAEKLKREADNKRRCETGASRLQETCKVIDDYEFDIVLVIDDFENFTSSKSIQMDHHATMRHLIKSHYATYVVATNYDFQKDSLPPAVSGSFLLMEFSRNEICLEGFSLTHCKAYLEAIGAEGCFTDKEILEIRNLSGGIPALLRITAEAAWDQKQLTPTMNDESWEAVQDRLYYNDRVKRYMKQWCQTLTTNQISVINSLLDESNPNGVVRGEVGPTAAAALRLRGLLMPVYRGSQIIADCYAFNSIVLQDYCNNTTLYASDPHDVQKQNISIQLHQMIEDGKVTEVLDMLRDICGLMGNVTMPFDFDAPLTDEILQKFELTQQLPNSFDPGVQEQIVNGIRVERTFIHVQMHDYAPVYISFAKAIELHLNQTVVPILKQVDPNYILTNKKMIKATTAPLMLGEINKMLKFYRDGLHSAVYEEAAKFCKDHGCGEFDKHWWKKLQEDLELAKEIRNDMPHTQPLSGEDGVKLLRLLFQGSDSFTSRCTKLRDSMAKASKKSGASLKVGDVVSGVVVGNSAISATVNIGAEKPANLHINNCDALPVVGTKINVKILEYFAPKGRFNVTMKGVPQP